MPSAHEGLPMVILEALQHGLPCVATKVSGHPEVLEDGVNGFLVNLDRPDEMAGKVIHLLENPGLWETMSEAAKKTAKDKFDINRQLAECIEQYESVIVKASGS